MRKLKGNLKKRNNTPLSLVDIFAPACTRASERSKAKHFVNHHSFLRLFEKGFSFDREVGEFLVDGNFLKLVLGALGSITPMSRVQNTLSNDLEALLQRHVSLHYRMPPRPPRLSDWGTII